jgi:hypothetical protein
MTSGARFRASAIRFALLATASNLAFTATASAQVADMSAAAVLLPDTVHVGQPFRIGVQVKTPRGVEAHFPAVLETTENLEQAGEAQVGTRRPLSGVSRAYYRMVAWTAGPHEVPPIRVEVTPASEDADPFEILVQVPPLTVETVLPAEIEELELRQALPFLNPLPFPWLLLLALVAFLVGLWAYRRFRQQEPETVEPERHLTPWERAVAALGELVEEWRAGGLEHDGFCDRLEAILHNYLSVTENWSPGLPIRAVVNGNRRLAHALNYSALVRFARLAGGYGGPIEASDTCRAWIVSRHAPEEATVATPASGEEQAERNGAPDRVASGKAAK